MGWEYGTYEREDKMHTGFLLGKPEGTTPLLNTSIYMAEYLIRCSLGGL
jgi:hypothetical protein